MQHWTRKHENGVTAWVEPNAHGPGFSYRCAGGGHDDAGEPEQGRLALATGGDAEQHGDAAADSKGTEACDERASDAATPQPDARLEGRHWFVSDDRLFGVDVTSETLEHAGLRACAVPFTVDGGDRFQYEDMKRERLEFYGATRADALAGAEAFLRARYKTIEPAGADAIPSGSVPLHEERIVLRSRDRFASATLAEVEPVAVG